MAALEAAMQRLESAVGRLETALQSVEALSHERQQLAEALAEARSDYDSFAMIAGTVAGRLDGTIGRIDAALGK